VLEVERLAIAIGSQEAIYCRRHGIVHAFIIFFYLLFGIALPIFIGTGAK
jgi:hypothetical protein